MSRKIYSDTFLKCHIIDYHGIFLDTLTLITSVIFYKLKP